MKVFSGIWRDPDLDEWVWEAGFKKNPDTIHEEEEIVFTGTTTSENLAAALADRAEAGLRKQQRELERLQLW